jgi:hypothetical protein
MSLWDLVPSQMQAISNVNIEQWMVSTKHYYNSQLSSIWHWSLVAFKSDTTQAKTSFEMREGLAETCLRKGVRVTKLIAFRPTI